MGKCEQLMPDKVTLKVESIFKDKVATPSHRQAGDEGETSMPLPADDVLMYNDAELRLSVQVKCASRLLAANACQSQSRGLYAHILGIKQQPLHSSRGQTLQSFHYCSKPYTASGARSQHKVVSCSSTARAVVACPWVPPLLC